jgi:cytochrome c oxidase assembly protein subunit 11
MQWPHSLGRANRTMVLKLLVVTVVMFGFGYALVPLYRHICEALGINVLSRVEGQGGSATGSRGNSLVDYSRVVTVEFDANARGPWAFAPEVRSLQVHPGEMTTVIYEFSNPQNRAMSAQAIASYAPAQAGSYFNKIECFCFNEYTLKPGESRHWPVVFFLDPKLPKDVTTITLSYTFFEVAGKQAAQRVPTPVGLAERAAAGGAS